MPESRVLPMICSARVLSTLETDAKSPSLDPKVMAPKAMRETTSPVFPSLEYCMFYRNGPVPMAQWSLMFCPRPSRDPPTGLALLQSKRNDGADFADWLPLLFEGVVRRNDHIG